MKLYTEKDIQEAIEYGTNCTRMDLGEIQYITMDDFLQQLTPIELPSDEEIDTECRKLPYEKHLDDGQYNDGQMAGFELGAYWMRQQILNQNK